MKQLEKTVEHICTSAKGRATAFVIGNTSDVFVEGHMYSTPLRETGELVYAGVIVRDVETAEEVARWVDGKVDYVFVDDEKKIRSMYYGPDDVGNIEKSVRGIISTSTLLTYKGNDLTVEAVDTLIGSIVGEVSGKRVALIGMGNLGSKVALKLVERGVHISAFRRNKQKLDAIVAGLNEIKPADTHARVIAMENIAHACANADIIIGTTNEKSVITMDDVQCAKPAVLLLDVGKGCFAQEVTEDSSRIVYRVDVSIVQKQAFLALVHTKSHYSKQLGRRSIPEAEATLVSIGIFGRKGEVIVDDIEHPTSIIGISAGDGTLEPSSDEVLKKISDLKSTFGIL
ncbi:MAG: NAD(P)-binding domain-containing protein [Patescibacteria group bacterium]